MWVVQKRREEKCNISLDMSVHSKKISYDQFRHEKAELLKQSIKILSSIAVMFATYSEISNTTLLNIHTVK